MARKLLIATLGTAPAVITEAIDLLTEQNVRPDGVQLLTTMDSDVQESCNLLLEHLPAHDGIAWVDPVPIAAYGDMDTPDAAVEFMQVACRLLKTYRDAGYRLFVSIAGGRKAMSALLALGVQFYGAERLFHVWVPPWIEAEGEITNLRKWKDFPDKINEALHPSLDVEESDRPRIVDLPFIGLFPLLNDIRAALQGEAAPPREIKQLLIANALLTGQGEPTPMGQTVAVILEGVEGLPPARQEECKVSIAKHHFSNRLERFAWELCGRFPYVTKIRSGEWRSGEGKVKVESPNIIRVFAPLGTDFPLQLILTTTATSEGQLEAARRDVERYLRRRR
ncbi:MAG: CRISPR-associated protein Csx14 [Deltaproteobacteria bacterium]|nr:CRISPR-associated protein Csx14 [Deltaproteobacteria bacterium]